jgi:hypothetical protein
MAALAMTELQAINAVLQAIGHERLTSAPSETDPSDGGSALYQLNRSRELVLAQGWRDNVDVCRPLTPAGSPLKVTLDSDVLAVRSSGPDHYRNFAIRNGFLWDLDRHSDEYPSSTVIYCDIVRMQTWDFLAPRLKHLVVEHAKLVHQRRKRGDTSTDQQLLQELVQTSATADLRGPRMDGAPINRFPMYQNIPGPQVQQGGGQ